MALFSVLPIILPLLGAAGVFLLSLVMRLRPHTRYLALAASAITAVLLLASRWMPPTAFVPSLWRPSLLFGTPLMLQSDIAVQPLALVLALALCSALLPAIAYAQEIPARLLALLLLLLSAGLTALWAANPLTMVIAWAVYDLVQMAAHIAAGGSSRAALRGLFFGSLATLLLWGGTLLRANDGSSDLWSLMAPARKQLTLWAAAGLLRLWSYPFHLAIPDDLEKTPSLPSLFLGPLIGWGLWLRLALANAGSLPGGVWAPALAAVTLAMGGFLAWSCGSARRILPWAGMAAGGTVLLAAHLAERNAASVITAGSVAWALGVTALSLHDGLRREAPWWSVPMAFGALALLGLPPTLGFMPQAVLLGGLTRRVLLGWGSAFFFGTLFLIPALVRNLLSPATFPLPNRRWRLALIGIGPALPSLLLITAGLYPPVISDRLSTLSLGTSFALPGLAGWLLWAVSLACGGVLAWQERNVRPRLELLLGAVHDLLRLEWLYGAIVEALDRGLSVLRAADEVVGGAGALLWSLLLFLLILLVGGRR